MFVFSLCKLLYAMHFLQTSYHANTVQVPWKYYLGNDGRREEKAWIEQMEYFF